MQIVVQLVGSWWQHQQMTLILMIQRPLMVNEQKRLRKTLDDYLFYLVCYIVVINGENDS